eukprot:5794200-Amphidinium_carterae.1
MPSVLVSAIPLSNSLINVRLLGNKRADALPFQWQSSADENKQLFPTHVDRGSIQDDEDVREETQFEYARRTFSEWMSSTLVQIDKGRTEVHQYGNGNCLPRDTHNDVKSIQDG